MTSELNHSISPPVEAEASSGHVVGFFVAGPDGRILEVNATLLERLGLPQEALAQEALPQEKNLAQADLHCQAILSPESWKRWERQWPNLSRQGFIAPLDVVFLGRDGHPDGNGRLLHAQVSITALRDSSGAGACIVQFESPGNFDGKPLSASKTQLAPKPEASPQHATDADLNALDFNIDIIELKLAELALQESEQRFRIMANASPTHIFEVAPDGMTIFINQTAIDFFEPGAEEAFRTGNIKHLFHPDDFNASHTRIQQALETHQGFRHEIRARRRDGQYRWLLSSVEPSLYPSGELHSLISSAMDITELKLTEFALRESEERFRIMADASPLQIYDIGPDGKLRYVNKTIQDFYGPENIDKLMDRGWLDFVHPDDRERMDRPVPHPSKMEPVAKEEFRMRRKDGVYRWMMTYTSPSFYPNGELYGLVGSAMDITERKEMEQALSKARDIAEEANKKKSQFLANMSHELRTPLNAVIGFSDMLKKGMAGPLTEKQGTYLQHIATSGRHLLAMVNDILDISKAEAGRIELFLQYVELDPFIRQLQELVSYSAEKSGVALTFEVQPGLVGLVADSDRLRQIFLNLISNAIKFNHQGGQVNVFLGRSKDQQWVICEIHDTGIGIPADKIGNLFNEFYQVDSSNSRRYGGTGLGLALTKQLVELHHGTILVESQEDVGSIFTFKLPINPYALGF